MGPSRVDRADRLRIQVAVTKIVVSGIGVQRNRDFVEPHRPAPVFIVDTNAVYNRGQVYSKITTPWEDAAKSRQRGRLEHHERLPLYDDVEGNRDSILRTHGCVVDFDRSGIRSHLRQTQD